MEPIRIIRRTDNGTIIFEVLPADRNRYFELLEARNPIRLGLVEVRLIEDIVRMNPNGFDLPRILKLFDLIEREATIIQE